MGCGGSKAASAAVPPSSAGAASVAGPASLSSDGGGMGGAGAAPREMKKPFALSYDLKEKLGQGQYAVVHKGISKRDGTIVAVKCIRKDKLTKEDLDALSVEVKAMEMLKDHPNFVKYYDFFSEKDYFFIVLELISGGELFDRICDKAKYSEREARKVMWLLASAIAYAHGKGIVHRDLKPENILLKAKDDDTSIKLADMGFAKILTKPNQLMATPCGTPGYVAPEVIQAHPSYGPKCDVWSLGVIFYILLCGYPPFAQEDQNELFAAIKSGKYEMDPAEWGVISESAKDLVRRILVVDPDKRMSASDILQHPWMKMDVSAIPDVDLAASLAQLKRYQARRRLKKAMNAVRATVRTRMLFAARAAKAAKAAGAGEDEVQQVFFEAARQAPSVRSIPTLPAPVTAVSPRGHQQQQQFRVAAIVGNPMSSAAAAATGSSPVSGGGAIGFAVGAGVAPAASGGGGAVEVRGPARA